MWNIWEDSSILRECEKCSRLRTATAVEWWIFGGECECEDVTSTQHRWNESISSTDMVHISASFRSTFISIRHRICHFGCLHLFQNSTSTLFFMCSRKMEAHFSRVILYLYAYHYLLSHKFSLSNGSEWFEDDEWWSVKISRIRDSIKNFPIIVKTSLSYENVQHFAILSFSTRFENVK